MKRDVLNSPRLRELKKKRRRTSHIKFALVIFAILFILVGATYLARIKTFNISTVEISGNKVTDGASMQTVISSDLAGYYLWFFPKTNVLFYPKNKIKEDLASTFKRLDSISFSLKNNTLLISVSEREGVYTWCGTNEPNTQDITKDCYFMDKTGYVFDKAPNFSGDVYFKFYGSVFQNPYPTFNALVALKANIELSGLKPVALYDAGDGNAKFYLPTNTTAYPEILFKTSSDLEKVAENLQTALTTEPLQTDFKNNYSKLLYIDLRFDNKVYYKFAQ